MGAGQWARPLRPFVVATFCKRMTKAGSCWKRHRLRRQSLHTSTCTPQTTGWTGESWKQSKEYSDFRFDYFSERIVITDHSEKLTLSSWTILVENYSGDPKTGHVPDPRLTLEALASASNSVEIQKPTIWKQATFRKPDFLKISFGMVGLKWCTTDNNEVVLGAILYLPCQIPTKKSGFQQMVNSRWLPKSPDFKRWLPKTLALNAIGLYGLLFTTSRFQIPTSLDTYPQVKVVLC